MLSVSVIYFAGAPHISLRIFSSIVLCIFSSLVPSLICSSLRFFMASLIACRATGSVSFLLAFSISLSVSEMAWSLSDEATEVSLMSRRVAFSDLTKAYPINDSPAPLRIIFDPVATVLICFALVASFSTFLFERLYLQRLFA